jgi:signal transduction histidine kinase
MTLMSRAPRRQETAREQQSRQWHFGLFALIVLLFGFLIAAAGRGSDPLGRIFLGILQIAVASLPLLFLFVAAYFEHRFEFFDLFVKRGLSLLVTIGILWVSFALLHPFLRSFDASAPLVYAIVLLPVVTALPWLYGRIDATLDRHWLGRRFTTVQAVTRFLDGLRSATSETQLVERAEDGLSAIFDAQVSVQLDRATDALAFKVVQEVPIRPGKDSPGRILLGQRASEAPYFSEDVALLTSLADVLAPVLDNLRLQRREREQDQHARELSLHASRSELKALRAQINPHFLFNALNAIAGLIHKDPAVADRTIEQLADVFRYALRGTESEWALLDEELEFVRAYLEVERARFGSRLCVDVRLDDDVRGARVPTMVVQTLVENAVKHGVALVRGPASVDVHARRDHGQLVVSVSDSGPGFPTASTGRIEPLAAGESRRHKPAVGGYGLANIRQRLEGYFGAAAALTVERDINGGRTIVSVSFPFVLHGGRHIVSAGTLKEPRS